MNWGNWGNWDWQVFCKDTVTEEVLKGCLGTGRDFSYLNWLLEAWGWTLLVSVLSLAVALVAGALVGIARTTPSKALVAFGEAWTELFRNIPLLAQVVLWYHVLPAFFPVLRTAVPPFVLVVLALGLFTSARVSEQVKAGILALPRGQRQAALALGLTLPQAYRHVLLPTAFRIVIPPLTSEAMNIVKNSAVAFAVSIPELAHFSQQVSEETAHFEEIFIPVTVLYFVSAFAINRVAVWIERAVRVPGTLGSR